MCLQTGRCSLKATAPVVVSGNQHNPDNILNLFVKKDLQVISNTGSLFTQRPENNHNNELVSEFDVSLRLFIPLVPDHLNQRYIFLCLSIKKKNTKCDT